MAKAELEAAKDRKQQSASAADLEAAFSSILLSGFLGFAFASIGVFLVRKKMS